MVCHIVDPVVIVPLDIDIDHLGFIMAALVALLLLVPLFLTVTADHICVPGPITFCWAIVVTWAAKALIWWVTVVAGMESGKLLDLLFSEVLPGNGVGLIWVQSAMTAAIIWVR
jgi:hypothetical protein